MTSFITKWLWKYFCWLWRSSTLLAHPAKHAIFRIVTAEPAIFVSPFGIVRWDLYICALVSCFDVEAEKDVLAVDRWLWASLYIYLDYQHHYLHFSRHFPICIVLISIPKPGDKACSYHLAEEPTITVKLTKNLNWMKAFIATCMGKVHGG